MGQFRESSEGDSERGRQRARETEGRSGTTYIEGGRERERERQGGESARESEGDSESVCVHARTVTCAHTPARLCAQTCAHARVRAANRHAQAFHGIPVRRLLFLPPPPPPPPLLPPSAMPLHPATHSSRIRCTHARGYRSRRRGRCNTAPEQPDATGRPAHSQRQPEARLRSRPCFRF